MRGWGADNTARVKFVYQNSFVGPKALGDNFNQQIRGNTIWEVASNRTEITY